MRSNARVAGVLFLVAMASSLIGGGLVETMPDAVGALRAGVALELLNAFAVVGIVTALWIPLSQRSPSLAAGYLSIRVLEAGACAAAALLPLADVSGGLRDVLTGVGVPLFFALGAVLLYVMLLRDRLVPRYLAVWGLVGAAGILANVVVGDPALGPVLALPMITNEIFLGVYLIAKGLRQRVRER